MDSQIVRTSRIDKIYNQTACANTRIVYVESGTDEESIEKIIEIGRKMVAAYAMLPPLLATGCHHFVVMNRPDISVLRMQDCRFQDWRSVARSRPCESAHR